MKTKHLFVTAAVSVPLFALLRNLQNIFVIDKNGCFISGNTLQVLLVSSVYFVSAILAAAAFILIIRRDKDAVDSIAVTTVPITGFLLILFALIQLFGSGYGFGGVISSGTFAVLPVLRLLSSVYFLLYGISLLTGKRPKALLTVLGFAPPVYAAAVGINLFFSSFDSAHVSYNQLEMLSTCAMAIMLYCICAAVAGVKITLRRFSTACMLFAAYASASTLGELYALFVLPRPADNLLIMAEQFLLIPVALIMLYRARKVPDSVAKDEPTEEFKAAMDDFDRAMNVYIDDIKEDKPTE